MSHSRIAASAAPPHAPVQRPIAELRDRLLCLCIRPSLARVAGPAGSIAAFSSMTKKLKPRSLLRHLRQRHRLRRDHRWWVVGREPRPLLRAGRCELGCLDWRGSGRGTSARAVRRLLRRVCWRRGDPARGRGEGSGQDKGATNLKQPCLAHLVVLGQLEGVGLCRVLRAMESIVSIAMLHAIASITYAKRPELPHDHVQALFVLFDQAIIHLILPPQVVVLLGQMHIEPLQLALKRLLRDVNVEASQCKARIGMDRVRLECLELGLKRGDLLAIHVELGA